MNQNISDAMCQMHVHSGMWDAGAISYMVGHAKEFSRWDSKGAQVTKLQTHLLSHVIQNLYCILPAAHLAIYINQSVVRHNIGLAPLLLHIFIAIIAVLIS